jgi:hypothetical protein
MGVEELVAEATSPLEEWGLCGGIRGGASTLCPGVRGAGGGKGARIGGNAGYGWQ